MLHPSEILYWEILPAIRRHLVVEMKQQGKKQSEIAKLLSVTPSAISQYINNKRADFDFTSDFNIKIKSSAKRIIEEKSNAFSETNFLIKEFERDKHICIICRKKNKLEGKCGVCFN